MPKVEVIAETLEYTDKNNVRSVYMNGQIFDMPDELLEANAEESPASQDGKQRARTVLGGRPSVRLAHTAAVVSEPVERKIVKPAPAPKPAGTEAK